jgi:ATP-dependent DNA helicase RecG
MAFDVMTVTAVQAERIASYSEGHFCELKSIDARLSRLTTTIAAFANADGGELYVGIDEDGKGQPRRWRGFADPEAANGHIQAFEALFPLSRDFQYSYLACSERPGLVLQLDIQKTRDIRRGADGTPYVRRGPQNLPVTTREQLRQLEYVKGLASFETEPVDVPADLVCNSVPILEFMLAVIPTAEPSAWLTKQMLLRDARPTVAGILLFAEEPQALLPKRC